MHFSAMYDTKDIVNEFYNAMQKCADTEDYTKYWVYAVDRHGATYADSTESKEEAKEIFEEWAEAKFNVTVIPGNEDGPFLDKDPLMIYKHEHHVSVA